MGGGACHEVPWNATGSSEEPRDVHSGEIWDFLMLWVEGWGIVERRPMAGILKSGGVGMLGSLFPGAENHEGPGADHILGRGETDFCFVDRQFLCKFFGGWIAA